jgi:hypothetical protein
MKKITFIIYLFSLIMGIHQTSAQTYNLLDSFAGTGLQGTFGDATAVYATNPVGTDQVIKLTNNGTAVWQGLDVILASNYRLTAATQLTMQLDVYSTTAITIAPKAQGGVAGAPESVTTATHNGSGWQTLTFTFNQSLDGKVPANGDYSDFAIHINWNTASNTFGAPDGRIFYIKNLKGLSVSAPVVPVPTVAAPTPTRNALDVFSLYSNAYTNLASWHPSWGQNTTYSEVQIAGNSTAKLAAFGYEGIVATSPINLTTMTSAHFDIWTNDETSIKIYLLIGGEPNVTKTLTANQWNSIDIPLTDFGTGSMAAANGFKLESGTYTWPNGINTIYVDNVYYWKPAAPVGTPVISGFSVPAKSLGDAPFVLTAPTSDSPGAFTYTSSNTTVATVSGNTVTVVGVGTSTITANQAASSPYLAGSITAILTVSPQAAPVPTLLASEVISMYGESYSNSFLYDFGANNLAGEPDLDPTSVVNKALKFNFELGGYGAGYTATDVSAMQFVHFDYYTTNASTFKLVLISSTGEKSYVLPTSQAIVYNSWKSVNIPMSYFTALGFNPATWFQYKFDVDGVVPGVPSIVYIDNIYFTSNSLGVKDFTKSNIKMYPNPTASVFTIEANEIVESVSLFNVLGQEVLTNKFNANTVSLDISNLQTGVYVVKTMVGGVSSTSRIVKK